MPDEKYIEDFLKKVSFPRLSGTSHEQKAAELIKTEIEGLELTPKIQSFTFTSFYPRIYKKISFILIFWLIFIFYLNINLIFSLFNVLLIFLIFIPIILITRNPERIRIGEKRNSKNVYINLKSQANGKVNQIATNNKLQVLFLCHIDSKSQRLSIKLRGVSVRLWIYSLLILIPLLVLKYLFFGENLLFNLFLIILIVSHFIATFLQIINTTHNKSPGSIDNASGICLVLDLLLFYIQKHNHLKNIDLWFIFTGSEETGTMGIRHFGNIIQDYDKSKIRYFNIDSVAKAIDIFGPLKKKVNNDKFLTKFFEMAKKLNPNFHLKRYLIAVNRSDGYYLKKIGLTGLGFGDKSSYNYIHSAQDTPDKVSAKFLGEVSEVIIKFLKEYDNTLK
ncbi:MAG: M28 family peptidase [Candidatus Lokiarchaeota archaeon]|nr:M28 family peptidase [Candidatus Lokiarchaeota archaeon]MBD3200127.1 M28 family peptidase [Candidatus Lokiarchaeota archaeon]